jgi:hypothetical protein
LCGTTGMCVICIDQLQTGNEKDINAQLYVSLFLERPFGYTSRFWGHGGPSGYIV